MRWLAAWQLTLILLTLRIWLPPHDFPHVPWFHFSVPRLGEVLLLSCLLAGWGTIAIFPHRIVWRFMTWVCLGAMILLNQHRTQPWAGHGWLALALSFCQNMDAWPHALHGLLVIIYSWSALSKLQGNFPQFFQHLFVSAGKTWQQDTAPNESLWWLLPMGELLTATFLLIPRLRLWGGYLSLMMHGWLIGWLGPWASAHSSAVLGWNLFLIGQNAMLYLGHRNYSLQQLHPQLKLLLLWVAVWPAGVQMGWCDPWLGWALYSPRPQEITVLVDDQALAQLPPKLRSTAILSHVVTTSFSGHSQFAWQVNLPRWSLEAVQAPIYPHPRFELGLILALIQSGHLPDSHFMVLLKRRRTSDHSVEIMTTHAEVIETAARFWFNAFPRS